MRECWRDFPSRNGNREVPRRDHTNHANCFARHLNADTRTHTRHRLAHQAQCLTGEKRENLPGAGCLADAFRQSLAFFARQQLAQFILTRQNLVRRLLQNLVTLLRRGARPSRKCRFGRSNGLLGLLFGGAGKMADHIIGVGWVDIDRDGSAIDPFASDKIFEVFGH